MKKKITILLIICVNSLFSQINTQEFDLLKTQIPEESVQLLVNSNTLLVGEFLYYKSYHIIPENSSLSDISLLNYVVLLSSDNHVVFNHKLHVKNSISSGEFFIPSTVKTGHYKLISYTNWSKNNIENSFSEQDIFVINPYNTETTNNATNISEKKVEIIKTKTLNKNVITDTYLGFKSNKTSYTSREKVIITVTNKYSNLKSSSISVRKIDSINIINNIKNKEVTTAYKPNTYYLPELRGELLTGKITSNNNASVKNKSISLSITGKNFIFKNVSTNNSGLFFFTLNEKYINTIAIVQVQEPNAEDYILEINTQEFLPKHLEFKKLLLNENIKDWVKRQSINNQIENAYYNIKTDSIISRNYNKPFFYPLVTTYTYKLEDYTRFKTIQETFVEIILAASIKPDGDDYKFVVNDYLNSEIVIPFFNTEPLVLVDGLLITNNSDIVNYRSNDIDKIAVVIGQYMYGSKVYDGIISFKTKNNDFSLNDISPKGDYIKQITIEKLENKKLYYSPNYEQNTSLLERIPDYRNQLLWLPNASLNKGENTYNFFTSDNLGTYEITIQGYTESGNLVKVNSFFTVN